VKELNNRDRRVLKKAFLENLNEVSNGNEELCFDRTEIFKQTRLGGYSLEVVPFIVQELIGEGLVKQCGSPMQVSITHKGKQGLQRNIENNAHTILETRQQHP
jgi:predicted transcriptional regulator